MEDSLKALRSIQSTSPARPFVTLTYAQSLDGSIALHAAGNHALRLSGTESMELTHRLRAMHQGILVGVDTVIADNPSLTTRLCPGPSPRPIVLDSRLRCPLDCKLANPMILCAIINDEEMTRKAKLWTEKGATVIECKVDANGRIDLATAIQGLEFDSIMIEGGAGVIRSTLESRCAQALVLTIAPKYVGGLVPTSHPWTKASPDIQVKSCMQLGNDIVMVGQF